MIVTKKEVVDMVKVVRTWVRSNEEKRERRPRKKR